MNIDASLRDMATEVSDTKKLAKLSSGDIHALDAVYHKNCMTDLYTRYCSARRKNTSKRVFSTNINADPMSLAEMVSFIENFHSSDTTHIFKLSELTKLYQDRVVQLGGDISSKVNLLD